MGLPRQLNRGCEHVRQSQSEGDLCIGASLCPYFSCRGWVSLDNSPVLFYVRVDHELSKSSVQTCHVPLQYDESSAGDLHTNKYIWIPQFGDTEICTETNTFGFHNLVILPGDNRDCEKVKVYQIGCQMKTETLTVFKSTQNTT